MPVHDIINAESTDGEIRCDLGDAERNQTRAKDAPVYSSAFLVGTPAPPSNGEAAQALWDWDGNDPVISGIRDNRYVSKLGTIQPGSWGIVTDSNALVKCVHDSDLIALQSQGQNSGQTQLIACDGESDSNLIRNGLASMVMEQDSITLSVGNSSSIVITATDITITSSTVYVNGGFVKLGAGAVTAQAATGPGPANVVSTVVSVALTP